MFMPKCTSWWCKGGRLQRRLSGVLLRWHQDTLISSLMFADTESMYFYTKLLRCSQTFSANKLLCFLSESTPGAYSSTRTHEQREYWLDNLPHKLNRANMIWKAVGAFPSPTVISMDRWVQDPVISREQWLPLLIVVIGPMEAYVKIYHLLLRLSSFASRCTFKTCFLLP